MEGNGNTRLAYLAVKTAILWLWSVSVHTVDVEAEVLDADPVVVYPQLDEGVEGDLKVGQLVHRVAHYQSQQAPDGCLVGDDEQVVGLCL